MNEIKRNITCCGDPNNCPIDYRQCPHGGLVDIQETRLLVAPEAPYAYHYEWASCVTTDGPQGFKWVFAKDAPPDWAVKDGQCRNVIALFTGTGTQPPAAQTEDLAGAVWDGPNTASQVDPCMGLPSKR